MIKIKPAAKMWAFRVSVTDKSVRRKWGLESKQQFTLCCDRGAWLATKPYYTDYYERYRGLEIESVYCMCAI